MPTDEQVEMRLAKREQADLNRQAAVARLREPVAAAPVGRVATRAPVAPLSDEARQDRAALAAKRAKKTRPMKLPPLAPITAPERRTLGALPAAPVGPAKQEPGIGGILLWPVEKLVSIEARRAVEDKVRGFIDKTAVTREEFQHAYHAGAAVTSPLTFENPLDEVKLAERHASNADALRSQLDPIRNPIEGVGRYGSDVAIGVLGFATGLIEGPFVSAAKGAAHSTSRDLYAGARADREFALEVRLAKAEQAGRGSRVVKDLIPDTTLAGRLAGVALPRALASAPVVAPAPVVAGAVLAAPLVPPGPPRAPKEPQGGGARKKRSPDVQEYVPHGDFENAALGVDVGLPSNADPESGGWHTGQDELGLGLHAPGVTAPALKPFVPVAAGGVLLGAGAVALRERVRAPPRGESTFKVQPVGAPVRFSSPSMSVGDSMMPVFGDVKQQVLGAAEQVRSAVAANPVGTVAVLGGGAATVLGTVATVRAVAAKRKKSKAKAKAKKSSSKKMVRKSSGKARPKAKKPKKGKKGKREDRGGVSRSTYRGQKVYKAKNGRHYVYRARKEGKMAKGTVKFLSE